MEERGLDRSVRDVRNELQRLSREGVPGFWDRLDSDLAQFDDQSRPLRGQVKLPAHRFAAAITEHTRAVQVRGASNITVLGSHGGDSRVTAIKRFFGLLADKKVGVPSDWRLTIVPGRSGADPLSRLVELRSSAGSPIAIHEWGHVIESSDARALARSLAFLKTRTRGEKLKHIPGHGPNELGWEDKFFSHYIGKDYGPRATEVTSMGYQALGGDRQSFEDLLAKDPEMLHFLLGQLAGR